MTKTAFDKIAAGLRDAIAFAEGDSSKGRLDPSVKRSAPIDDFHRHEVLHGTAMVQSLFDDFIAGHVYTKSDAELTAAAEEISRAIADFYQAVGTKIDR
ncbi:hypothetical protein [Sphingomonas fennica]|uniref:hypothetical protein n=1 Tax=Edaphosphingomonas fennica TaxID=114404 RepID=UPI0011B270A5|nr:hypothetical protein [Sphingomonas fennica]